MATFGSPHTTGDLDTHGHTVDDDLPANAVAITMAEAEADSGNDTDGALEDPDATFLAQTPDEVAAQIANAPGESA